MNFFRNRQVKAEPVTSIDPRSDETSIGNIMITIGMIEKPQLDVILKRQSECGPDVQFGDVVVAMGICDHDDIGRVMDLQKQMRNGYTAVASMTALELHTERYSETARKLSDIVKTKVAKRAESGTFVKVDLSGVERVA